MPFSCEADPQVIDRSFDLMKVGVVVGDTEEEGESSGPNYK